MCGLFGGISSVLSPADRSFLGDLMLLNSWRGKDSTGIMDYVPLVSLPIKKKFSQNYMTWKSIDEPYDFYREYWLDIAVERWMKSPAKIIAGHTRAATKGTVIRKNAHPFVHGPIIGMHNGTITGEFENSKLFDTDSEAIYYNINKLGLKETIDDLGKHSAAYALVWMNTQENTLNFLKNDKRPLHYARLGENGSTIYWSSEKEDLEYLLKKHMLYNWTVKSFIVDQHYKVDLESAFIDITQTQVKPKPFVYTTSTTTTVGSDNRGSSRYPSYPCYSETRYTSGGPGGHKTAENFSEEYYLDFGTQTKNGYNRNWDVASRLWLSDWALQRITEIRREKKNRKNTEKETKASKSTQGSLELSDPPFDKDEDDGEPVYTIFGEEVSYAQWYEATRRGCGWQGETVMDPDAVFWVDKTTPICIDCCHAAMNEKSNLEETFFFIFPNVKERVKDFLKNFKKKEAH